MKKKLPVNIKFDQTKFENLSFEQWKSLVPDIINYDLQLSNIEKLDKILFTKLQLDAYIKNRGTIPNDIKPKVDELIKDEARIKQIKKEQEIAEYDSSFKHDDQEELKKLEDIVNYKIVHLNNIDESKPEYLYFNNPYFLNEDNQRFDSRLANLQAEHKDLEWIIKKELKPSFKKSKKLLDAIGEDIKRILKIKNTNTSFDNLIKFVRPYIDNIINSDDLYYNELMAMAI